MPSAKSSSPSGGIFRTDHYKAALMAHKPLDRHRIESTHSLHRLGQTGQHRRGSFQLISIASIAASIRLGGQRVAKGEIQMHGPGARL